MEIERKFLVKGDFKQHSTDNYTIKQAYLSNENESTVRIRITDNKSFITIKGKSRDNGLSRYEWEKEIALDEAKELLSLSIYPLIEKTRYLVPEEGGLVFEVDVFEGYYHGLIIAEIELPTKEATFTKPEWLGKEVTGDIRYYNSHLSRNKVSF